MEFFGRTPLRGGQGPQFMCLYRSQWARTHKLSVLSSSEWGMSKKLNLLYFLYKYRENSKKHASTPVDVFVSRKPSIGSRTCLFLEAFHMLRAHASLHVYNRHMFLLCSRDQKHVPRYLVDSCCLIVQVWAVCVSPLDKDTSLAMSHPKALIKSTSYCQWLEDRRVEHLAQLHI